MTENTQQSVAQPTGKKILIIEDEKPLLEAVKMKLEKGGFSVVTARTIKQALSNMEEIPHIDAIWLDHYLLGNETGLDFVAKIKNNEKWKKIPVLVVSNTASPDKIQSYLQLGITKYFTKSDYRLEQIIEELKKSIVEEE